MLCAFIGEIQRSGIAVDSGRGLVAALRHITRQDIIIGEVGKWHRESMPPCRYFLE